MKIVVFDLDETLGYFTQFGIFWDCLGKYVKGNQGTTFLSQDIFNQCLDLFPEYLRPNILSILSFLKRKKETQCCHKMLVYTNNTGPREWAKHIIQYFEHKLGTPLVDQIIAAFKINGKRVEICRTTQDKTHHDLVKCTQIPADAKICFIDDTFYPDMANDHIYYIHVKPYYYSLPFETLIDRILQANILQVQRETFRSTMLELVRTYHYDVTPKEEKEYAVDAIVGKHILTHLHAFFRKRPRDRHTRKKQPMRRSNLTRRGAK